MAPRQSRYELDEMARRGTERYEQKVRPLVEQGNRGRFVAIDVDTGEFEMADTSLAAATNLLTRLPEAQIWCLRIGYKAVRHFSPPLHPEEA